MSEAAMETQGELVPVEPGSKQLATPAEAPGSLLNFIAQAVERPEIDADKLDKLLRMQREIVADDAKAQFNRDFIALQDELPRIKKDGELVYPDKKGGEKLVSKYARWESIDREIRPILKAHGFALSFTTAPRQGDGGGLIVTAILRHRAGHSTETPIPIPLDTSGGKNNIQGYGSALSYGKRYAATAALNIITEGEDDDGKLAGTKFVTIEQAVEIDTLLRETKSDAARFCQLFEVADVRNLTADQYPAARNMLLSKKGRA